MRSSRTLDHAALDVIRPDHIHLDVIGHAPTGNLQPRPRVRLTDGGAYLIDTDGKFIID